MLGMRLTDRDETGRAISMWSGFDQGRHEAGRYLADLARLTRYVWVEDIMASVIVGARGQE